MADEMQDLISDEAELTEEEDDHEDTCWFKCLRCFVKYKRLFLLLAFLVFGAHVTIVMMEHEGWQFLTSLYVTTQIVTTIGYGDLTPTNDRSRLLIALYVLFISVFIAGILNEYGEKLVDDHQSHIRRHLIHLKAQRVSGRKNNKIYGFMRFRLPALTAAFFIFAIFVAFGTIFYAEYQMEKCSCSYGTTKANNYENCTQPTACETGATKNYAQSFYMSIITLTTVGFGDYTPLSKTGRGIGIPWMFFGVLATANFIGCMVTTMKAMQTKQKSAAQVSQELLEKIDANDDQALDKHEFAVYMMVKNGYMTMEDLNTFTDIFRAVDKNNNGFITAKSDKIRDRDLFEKASGQG